MALLVRPFFLDRITEYPRRILILADPVMAALPSKPRSRSDGRERRLGGVELGGRSPFLPPRFSRQPQKFLGSDRGEPVAHRLQRLPSFKWALEPR